MDRTSHPHIYFPSVKSLPCVEKSLLKNGVEQYVLQIDNTELVRMDFMFMGGSWIQSHPLQASLAVGNLKEGTNKHNSFEINELLDFYGANFSYVVTNTFSAISVTFLKKFAEKVVVIINEILKQPAYDASELKIKIQLLWTNYEIQSNQVRTQAERLFFDTLLGPQHPLSSYPQPEQFQNVDTNLLWDYYNKLLGSSNCRIFITGNVDDSLLHIIENHFGNERWGSELSISEVRSMMCLNKATAENHEDTINTFNMPQPTVQSCIFAGTTFEKVKGREKAAMLVFNTLLGGFFGSRLMKNVREEKGLTYGISSYITTTHLFNVLCVKTDTKNDSVSKVVNEIRKEIKSLADGCIANDELDVAKKYYAGLICRTYEANFAYSNRVMKKISIGEDYNDVLNIQNHVFDISIDDIVNFAHNYLPLNRFVWCVAGSTK